MGPTMHVNNFRVAYSVVKKCFPCGNNNNHLPFPAEPPGGVCIIDDDLCFAALVEEAR